MADYPHPEVDRAAFKAKVTLLNRNTAPVFTPATGRKQAWIDVAKIPGTEQSRACVIC
jgi:hypothetical protein